MEIEPGKRRIDFGGTTKDLLREAAGHRCCFPTCLSLTSGVSSKDGEDRLRGVGVAAHVYSAAEKGPRGQGGLTPDQVRHKSNGLWMCAKDGREVDDFQEKYPAEYLLRMKAVRELAHELERSNHDVAYYVKEVGVRMWNECVWEYVAETPVPQISFIDSGPMIKAFISAAKQNVAVLAHYELTLQPKLPEHLAVKPIPAAAAALVRPVAQTASTLPLGLDDALARAIRFAHERTRVMDIITALGNTHRRGPSGYAFVVDGAVFLTAVDPTTGARYNDGVWQHASISGGVNYSPDSGEEVWLSVAGSDDRGSGFTWTLQAELKAGFARLDNALEKRPLHIPYLRRPMTRIEFDRYRNLLAKIAEGWKPLAFVSLIEHGLDDLSSLYPCPFEPRLVISTRELAELEYVCDKVATGLGVATRWGEYWCGVGSPSADFDFDDLFFADYIDRDLVLYAYEELIAACLLNRTDPLMWRTEPLIMTSPRTGILFRYRQSMLAFEHVVI